MTLCIGALAIRVPAGSAAIVAWDRRTEGAGVSEVAYKGRQLTRNWWGMFSGDTSNARELLGLFEEHLVAHEHELTHTNAVRELWKPIYAQESEFRKRLRVPDCVENQLILVGFIEGQFRLFRFMQDWQEFDSFTSIGSGWYVAESMLCRRERSSLRFVPEMVYRVYEAQRLAAGIPQVGMRSSIFLLTHESGSMRVRELQPSDFLESLWKRFVPENELTRDFTEEQFTWHTFEQI